MIYPKINTIWKRDPKKNNCIMEGEFSLPEFADVKRWVCQEKIDGTNVRIHLTPDNAPAFYGRQGISILPNQIIEVLREYFSDELRGDDIWIFCEGYGGKIQKYGHLYSDTASLAVFDVYTNKEWISPKCLRQSYFKYIQNPSILGEFTTDEVIEFIKSKPRSKIANNCCPMEGLVLKTDPVICLPDGKPLYAKIKVRDYQQLEGQKRK